MKKFFTAIVAVAAMALAFTACNKDDNSSSSQYLFLADSKCSFAQVDDACKYLIGGAAMYEISQHKTAYSSQAEAKSAAQACASNLNNKLKLASQDNEEAMSYIAICVGASMKDLGVSSDPQKWAETAVKAVECYTRVAKAGKDNEIKYVVINQAEEIVDSITYSLN